MSRPPPIKVQGLNHSYGKGELKKQILFDVSVEIQAGEIVIVSTLEAVRRQIGFIFQQHNLLGALTSLQNVELGIKASGKFPRSVHRQRATEMLEAVGLGDRLQHKPDELSGGQRQRVAIARALVSEPAIVMADEQTASLDKQSGREVVDRMKVLAKEHGTTILLVTHDNRILDIADRIVHLEDGRLSTFTDAVLANNQHMMKMLASNRQKQPMAEMVDGLNESQFEDLLREITDESQRFLEATSLASNVAFRSMLEQGLFAFTRKLGGLLNAERSSLFLVEGDFLVLKVAENVQELGEIRFPVGTGIAGTVAETGQTIRIEDAYADDRFNPEVDRQSGFRTRSILCLPVKNRDGEVFAVAQLLNRRDGKPFDELDEQRFTTFIQSIGVIFETQLGLAEQDW
jgi:putative ABC transport system ATP-binding protein